MNNRTHFEHKVLYTFPYPVAVRYRRLVDADSYEEKSEAAISVYEAVLRSVTLGVLAEYVQQDRSLEAGARLLDLAWKLVEHPQSLGTWTDVFLETMQILRGQREQFFIKELYDLYWDFQAKPSRYQDELRDDLKSMVSLASTMLGNRPTEPNEWKTFYRRIDVALHKILPRFDFVTEYDLLHIISAEETAYHYEVYKGQQVTRGMHPLTTNQSLRQGWCYLKKSGHDRLLEIHPLIILWQDDLGATEKSSELAIYYWYEEQEERLWYLHSTKEKVQTTKSDLVNVFSRVYYEKIKSSRTRLVVGPLEWLDLKYLEEKHNGQPLIKSAQLKFDPDVYLQRENIHNAYADFLQSDRYGLILVGPSGVGKSSFVFSIIEESKTVDTKACILVYKGLNPLLNFERISRRNFIDDTNFADALANCFEDILIQDFKKHLSLQRKGYVGGSVILEALDDLMNRHKGQIVIVIDAINENRRGDLLLKAINRFLQVHSYPWLKLIITSRPESWNDIRKGIPLSDETYFRVQEADNGESASYQPVKDDPVVRIRPFAPEELPLVYAKYRDKYQLQTQYHELTQPWKLHLSDPFTLRIESQIARDEYGGQIPLDIPFADLIDRYIDMLLKTERLEEHDREFLEEELLPRLFRAPEYPNQLLHTDLIGQKTVSGNSLYDAIFNYDTYMVDSGPYRVNQSFVNLADALILAKSELTVQFQYERFYEYFGGKHLSEVANGNIEFYRELADALEHRPYLWGAVKNAFRRELAKSRRDEGSYQFFAEFASIATSNRRLFRNAIITAFYEFSRTNANNYQHAKSLITELIKPCIGPARSSAETLRRLLRRSKYEKEQIETRQLVAIEVAGRLALEETLLNAAADRYAAPRRAAVVQIFRLWQSERSVGYGIIDRLSQFAVGGLGLPDLGVIDSLISLSIAMLVHAHTDKDVQEHLLRLGRRVIRNILVLSPETGLRRASLARRAFARVLRRPLLAAATGWGLSVIKYWSYKSMPVTFEALENFFSLTSAEKELAYPLIPFFEAERAGLVNYIEQTMVVEDVGDSVLGFISVAPRLVRVETNYQENLAVLQELVDRSLAQNPPRAMIENYLWCTLILAERQRDPDPALFRIAERCIDAIAEDPRRWHKSHVETSAVPTLALTAGLGNYIMMLHTYGKPIKSERLRKWIGRAIGEDDTEFLETFINVEVSYVFDTGYLGPALEALQLVANYQDEDGKVQNALANLLVRMYFYFPEEIENALSQGQFSTETASLIRALAPSDRVNDLLGIRAIGVLVDLFLLGPKILQEETIYLVEEAMQLPDLKSVVALLIKEMLNLLAGEAVFAVPADSPSRRIVNQRTETSANRVLKD